jgi:LCP family protein required for cell wall assembly
LAPTVAGTDTTMNILVVGTDTRLGYAGPARGDAIALVRISEAEGVTAVLSIPRDLYVAGANVVDGAAVPDRINVAAADRRRLVGIVQRETGLRVDHYAELDGVGFRRLIDALGGVTIYTADAVRDRFSGLALSAGCNRLDGEQALAWDRSRHLESYENGRWIADPTGDLGRIQRQQQLALTALRTLGVTRDPRTLTRVLDIAADNLRVDDDFPFGRVRQWADATTQRDGDVALLVLPTTPASLPTGAAGLTLDQTQLDATRHAFNAVPHGTAQPTPPSPCVTPTTR